MPNVSKPMVILVERCSPHIIGPSRFILSFLPCFRSFLWKNELRSFPLGREPLCYSPGEVLGEQR